MAVKLEDPAARQRVIADWTCSTFGVEVMDPHERVMRVLEEAIELAQAEGITEEEADRLLRYVFSRPIGDPIKELGGLRLTISGYAEVRGYSAEQAEIDEVRRVLSTDPEKFRRRNVEKKAAGVGSGLGSWPALKTMDLGSSLQHESECRARNGFDLCNCIELRPPHRKGSL